jgi:hypothetical protein
MSRRLTLILSVLPIVPTVSNAQQSRPAASAPAPAAAARERVAAQMRELATLIENRVEARRKADRAAAQLSITTAAAATGDVSQFAPGLIQSEYQLRQVELERDLAVEQGSASARALSLAKRAQVMRSAYEARVAQARAVAAAAIAEAKREDDVARGELDEATRRVDAAQNALLDLIVPMIR